MSKVRRLKPIRGGENVRSAYTWKEHERRRARERFEENSAKRKAESFGEAIQEQDEYSDGKRPLKYIGAKKRGGPGIAS